MKLKDAIALLAAETIDILLEKLRLAEQRAEEMETRYDRLTLDYAALRARTPGPGQWRWAELGPTLDESPESPNVVCFCLVWVPELEEEARILRARRPGPFQP